MRNNVDMHIEIRTIFRLQSQQLLLKLLSIPFNMAPVSKLDKCFSFENGMLSSDCAAFYYKAQSLINSFLLKVIISPFTKLLIGSIYTQLCENKKD